MFIFQNIHIRAFTPDFVKWAFSEYSSLGNWMPMTWISYALDYYVWGLNPKGFHLSGILLHAANSALVVLFVMSILHAGHRLTHGAHSYIFFTAGVAGLMFGLHPLHVEPAVWAADRRDLLCGFFFLLSLISYGRYAGDRRSALEAGRRHEFFRRPYYGLTFLFFLLALASKSMAVTLPILFFLLDWYPFGKVRSFREAFSVIPDKIPFFAVSLIAGWFAYLGQKTVGGLSFSNSVPFAERILVAFRSTVMYLGKLLYPSVLLPFYPYPDPVSAVSPPFLVPIILVLLITAAGVMMAKKRPLILFCWLFYLICLLPVIGIIQIGEHAMADRYVYLPSLGPMLLLGMGAGWIWSRAGKYVMLGIPAGVFIGICTLLILAALAAASVFQIRIWRDTITLWSHVIRHEPVRVPGAYHNRAVALRDTGRFPEALADYTRAISLKPLSAGSYINRGVLLDEMGQFDEALEDFDVALRLDPRAADAFIGRGTVLKRKGFFDLAMADFMRAVELNPAGPLGLNSRGMLYQELGRPDMAIADFARAVSIDPYFEQAYVNRGLANEQTGNMEAAMDDYSAAIRVNPFFANAFNNRGLLFERAGRLDKALEDLNTAIKLNPAGVEAYNNRGLVYEDMGQFDRAIEDYGKAIELRPGDHLAYSNRGIAYGKVGKPNLARRDFQKACDLGSESGCEAVRKN